MDYLCRRILGSCTLSCVYLQQVLLSTEKDIEILNIQTGHCALWPWPFEFMTCSYLEINKHCNEPTNFYLVCIFFLKKTI